MASAYSVRPRPDARVSAPVSWRELRSCDPADFTLRTMPARWQKIGDPHEGIDAAVCSLESLLELSARHERKARAMRLGRRTTASRRASRVAHHRPAAGSQARQADRVHVCFEGPLIERRWDCGSRPAMTGYFAAPNTFASS